MARAHDAAKKRPSRATPEIADRDLLRPPKTERRRDTMPHWVLFAGTANAPLAANVLQELHATPGACIVERFPDGEVAVQIEESVRGRDVFILQPTSPPVGDRLLELLIFADACHRADARRITAIVPYFGYARADKRQGRRGSVTARTVADLMESVGIAHIVTLDVHTQQIEGFFRIPTDNLSAVPVLSAALADRIPERAVIVAPDMGALHLATEYSERLGCPTAVCVKRRTGGQSVSVAQVIGDVRGRPCVIVDDMITTGGTVVACARALVDAGARAGFIVAATHGVLVSGVRDRLNGAGVTDVIVTDTIAGPEGGIPPVRRVTIAPLLAEVVRRLIADESLKSLL